MARRQQAVADGIEVVRVLHSARDIHVILAVRRERGTSLISTVGEAKEPRKHARKRLMQAA